MAILKVNDDGSIGIKKNKNKKKTADLIVGEDGKITFNAAKVKSSLSQNNDIAPVRTDVKRSWFKSGLFEDGYDFGDVTKTILGTNKDFADDFFAGVAGIGEGVVDTAAYAAGGIAKKLGKDEFAKKTQKFIERDLVEEYQLGDKLARQVNPGIKGISLLNELVNKSGSEKASVLGEKTDSLVQSGGQLAGTFALQSVGVPWWLTTGVTSFGGGTEEAFQNDATYGEAGAYGLINAGAEILTEKIFGGIKFGGKALDEGLKKKLAGGIANKTLRTLTKFGWDMAGEGTEEVLSDVITNIGKKLTYEDEATLKELVLSEEAMDGYLESFIGGAVLGGGFNVGKLRNSVKTGRDYDTGLTDNEQSVVDAEIKSRTAEKQKNAAAKERISRVIEEQEKTFGTLSETEKKRIKERVQTQLDNGEIDFTTAQLSKQEQAEIEKQVREDLEKGYIGIDSIESTLASEKTSKIKELESQLINITDDAKKAEIQAEIKQLVADRATQLTGILSKDGYLQESYRQEALKKKEFSREVKEEDSDITKELLESAKNSKMNDTRRMHELFEYTNKIANDTGTRYGFVNNEQLKQLGHDVEGRTINGLVRVNEDGTTKVLINVDSDKSLNTIIGHETTHLFEGTSEYKALQDIAKEYAITKGEYDSRLKQIQSLYEGTNANVENEITADLVGDYLFTDEQFINSLSTKQPNVFQKIYDYIKHAYKMATAGSKEARQLEQLKRRFDKAYKEMSKTTTGKVDSNLTKEADSDTKYSISDNQGRQLTKEQQEYFKDSQARDENGSLATVYHGTNNAGFTVFKRNVNFYTDSKDVAGTYTNKDGVYEGYLNIKNPLVIDADGEKWSRIDVAQVDPAVADLFNEFGVSTFMEDGAERTSTADIVGAVEDGIDDGVFDYDGIIFKNIYDEGMFGNVAAGTLKSNVYVTFSSNQFKNVDNTKPTSDPDIRFSLSEKGTMVDGNNNEVTLQASDAGTHGTLMAIRNIGEAELKGMLTLGGIPVPSIAITDPAKVNHSNFGRISVLFDKETIDPANKKNEVYDRDIWSSRFPNLEYEINDEKASEMYRRAREVGNVTFFNPVDLYPDNIKEKLDRNGGEIGLVERYKDDVGMKNFYLAETSEPVKLIKTEKVTEVSPGEAEQFNYILERMGNEIAEVSSMTGREWNKKYGERFKETQREYWRNLIPDITEDELAQIVDNVIPPKQLMLARRINNFTKDGGRKVEIIDDISATREAINNKVNQTEYQNWLRDLFRGVEKSIGIPNGRDPYTPSGDRRSFKQLHDPFSLENLVKNMTKGNTQGAESTIGGKSFGSISSNMAKRFSSIEELKQHEAKITAQADEIISPLRNEFEDNVRELTPYYKGDDWNAFSSASEAIFEFSQKKLTADNLRKALEGNYFDSKAVPNDLLNSVVSNLNSLKDIPSDYFEAKPQRAVGLDEIRAIVLPNDTDIALKQELSDKGFYVIEYEPAIEGDRQNKINQFDDLKFSLSKPGEIAPVSGYNVYGRDVKKKTVEDIAPVAESTTNAVNTAEDIAPVREIYEPGRALTEEDLPYIEQEREESFRNITEDSAPVEQEYYNMPDTAPLDDKSLKLLSKNMRQELGLKNNQIAGLRKIIQDFSTSETASKEDLYNAIESEFGTIYEKKKLDTVQEIKAALRSMRINVSDTIKSDIPDYFQFKQRNFGKIRFANDGLAVDDVYEGLKDIYPEYFPDDIANPTDQLLKIADVVNMDANYIEEYALPEEQIQDVTDYIYESILDYKRQKRQEASENAAKAPIDESMIPYEVSEPVEDIAPVREDLKQKESNNEAEPEDLVTKTKKELRKQLLVDESDFFAKALDNAKNRSMILMNNTDTIRNTELVFGRENGKKINDLIFQKEIDNEAKSIAWQNKERAEIKALGIKARSKESAAVQKWGEGKYVDEFGDLVEYKDSDLMTEFPDVETQKKIKNAAKVIRGKYDNYIAAANDVLTQLGFEPIKKRDDYMRHFQELTDVFSRYGIPFNAQNMQEHVLPTDINGLTEFWSPQKNYFANMQPRKGIRTTLDAITGIDGYIGGVANLIYHTEDIQRGRAFEEMIRDTYGEDKGWDNLENLPEDQQMARAEKIQDNHLSNYAAWVHEWTNNIAGKKSKIDRSVESMFGRKAFSFLDQTRKQVGANMIGLNLSSSLTNLIASVQAMAKTNKLAVAKGTADTIKNIFIKDNFMEKNNFLTSRMGTDMLSKTAWQKIQDAGFVFMKGMDWFSSNQIVRSKYYELRSKGMSEEQAHTEAGKFAARIMGDRTKGANAQLYNSKMVGLVTQFQLEVNNQLYSMFYDTYHESKENAKNNALRTAAGMTFTLGQLFAFTHLFGKTFESIAGYNPTFDIIGIIATALGVGDDDDDKSTSERLKEAADQLVDALPYVNILTGGGRIPVASGIPNIVGVMTGGKDDYGNELTWEDELKKLLYLAPPTGGNQIKKTTQGLKMFDEDNPVPGSYTDNGNLRFPVEDTPLNRIQAGLFGQWSNENAREYFDNKRQPLKEKQIQEYKDLDLPIADYWKYRDGLKEQKTLEDKFNYIADLDLPVSKKNIMINNIVDRKEKVDMINYDDFSSYEEFDFATKNPEKYSFLESMGVSYKDYKSSDEAKEAYDWAFNNPEKYSLAKAAAGDVVTYRSYASALNELKADKDSNGKTISGSRKAKVAEYINGLSADYGKKIILFKSEYPSDDTYNYEIIDYLNNREDITYSEMETILKELGFTVDAAGNVRW